MKKILLAIALGVAAVAASLGLQSCQVEVVGPDYSYFEHRSFVAQDISGRFNWVLDFDYDNYFTITPYDFAGYRIYELDQYTGRYRVNFNTDEIYVDYYGYGTRSTWYFDGSYSDLHIYTPAGTGPVDNLVFYPYNY